MIEPEPTVRIHDGIEEHDNPLPKWWLGILWGTILFAYGYWFYYEVARAGQTPMQAYHAEVAEAEARLASLRPVDDAELARLATDGQVLARGKEVFAQTCAACHGPEGQGIVGPNLTDGYFLHGASPLQIHTVIAGGVVEKGMPAWGAGLGPERVKDVSAFVLSLMGRDLPGRPPQGTLAN